VRNLLWCRYFHWCGSRTRQKQQVCSAVRPSACSAIQSGSRDWLNKVLWHKCCHCPTDALIRLYVPTVRSGVVDGAAAVEPAGAGASVAVAGVGGAPAAAHKRGGKRGGKAKKGGGGGKKAASGGDSGSAGGGSRSKAGAGSAGSFGAGAGGGAAVVVDARDVEKVRHPEHSVEVMVFSCSRTCVNGVDEMHLVHRWPLATYRRAGKAAVRWGAPRSALLT